MGTTASKPAADDQTEKYDSARWLALFENRTSEELQALRALTPQLNAKINAAVLLESYQHQKVLTFLKLPYEIRSMIYNVVVLEDGNNKHYCQCRRALCRDWYQKWNNNASILMVCRQIREEAIPIMRQAFVLRLNRRYPVTSRLRNWATKRSRPSICPTMHVKYHKLQLQTIEVDKCYFVHLYFDSLRKYEARQILADLGYLFQGLTKELDPKSIKVILDFSNNGTCMLKDEENGLALIDLLETQLPLYPKAVASPSREAMARTFGDIRRVESQASALVKNKMLALMEKHPDQFRDNFSR